MSMRVSNRNERKDKAGKHNDRNFNLDNASHIDQDKVKDNVYYTYNNDTEHSFSEIEYGFYHEHFSHYIEAQNKKNIEARHASRNKDIQQYVTSKNTRPEDKILQIGNMFEHASKEELWECALEYKRQFEEHYGDKCKILDMALHMDEATPHVHVRRVWIAEDENGLEYVSQTKALEQLGIQRPDMSADEGRFNNAKMTFTHMDLFMFYNICKDKGLDVERPIDAITKKERLETDDYKIVKQEERIRKYETQLKQMESQVEDGKEILDSIDNIISAIESYIYADDIFREMYAKEYEEAKRKSREHQIKSIARIMAKESIRISDVSSLHEAAMRANNNAELNRLRKYIQDAGLEKDYNDYRNKQGNYKKDNQKEEDEKPRTKHETFF